MGDHQSPGAAYLSSLACDTVDLLFCERFDGTSRIWNFERHSHGVFEFLYFLDGGARIQAGSGELTAGLFDLVVYPPGVPHEERLLPGYRNEIICFWADLGDAPPFPEGLSVTDTTGELRPLVEALYAEAVARRPLGQEVITSYLKTLLLLMRRALEAGPQNDSGLVSRCLGYIHEHYTEDFDVEAMARAVAVSPSYLFRSFKRKLGLTPMQYRAAARVEKAKLLLCQSDRRIELVALEVGFADVKHFSQLFRRLAGMTPGAFRTANRRG